MVNTVTKIDGQNIAIEAPETQDSDEPPIGGLKRPNLDDHQDPKYHHSSSFDSKKDGLNIPKLPTAGSSIVDARSSDGGTLNNTENSWNGDPGAAHLIDAQDVAAQLDVDPRYFREKVFLVAIPILIFLGSVFQLSKHPTVSKRMVPTKSMEQIPSRWSRFCLDRFPIV